MDYMAAMILVPENDFKNELKSLNVKLPLKDEEKLPANIISYLAYTFQVDEDVIERRIKEVA